MCIVYSTKERMLVDNIVKTIAALTLLFKFAVAQECGTIGHTGTQSDTAIRQDAFYINRGDPAECDGMITSVLFCIYRSQITGNNKHSAFFAVYKKQGNVYNRTSAAKELLLNNGPYNNVFQGGADFGCTDMPINPNLFIEQGDVLGICVYNPTGSNIRLELAGTTPGNDTGDVLSMDPGPNGCQTLETVPSSFNSSGGLVSNATVYISANIVPLPTTQPPTTQLPTTQPLTTMPLTTNNETPPSSNSALTGAIVAIVIIIVIVIVVVVIVVLTIVLLKWRGHKQGSRDLAPAPTNGIENMIYEKEEQLESAEHVYEFEDVRSDEYAEIGDAYQGGAEVVYESPLDAPVVSYSKLLQKNQEEDIYEGENPYEVPATLEPEIYAQLKSWNVRAIYIKDVQTKGHLGSGQFGSVERGVWTVDRSRQIDVALKSLNSTEEQDKVKFLQEAAIMAQFKHPNVIKLHGVITRNKPMMLVVEMAEKGDLREYLLSIRPNSGELVPPDTPNLLLKFSQQVALGMQYLSAKGFVHRDLAARNVLLTGTCICKVADFGMSRDLADEDYYMSHGKDKIPVKWTAPEAINFKKYSTASDVWAYGCVLYEVWSIGHKPFEGFGNMEVIGMVDRGERLAPPPGCPLSVYELMISCWHPNSSKRGKFRDIVLILIGNESSLLDIPPSKTSPQSGVLGAPLEEWKNVYPELQNKYVTELRV